MDPASSAAMNTIANRIETRYTPLHLKEIRLLELLPGDFDDDLVINLRVVSLQQEKPKYEALSYVWGKVICTRQAVVQGLPMTIGRNLDCALRYLRYPSGEPRVLWVDAICINQADIEERSSQVKMMGQIYATAEKTLIWLGPTRPEDQYIFDFAETRTIPESWTEARPLLRAFKRVCRRP